MTAPWSEVPLSTPWAELTPCTLLIYTDDRSRLVRARIYRTRGTIEVKPPRTGLRRRPSWLLDHDAAVDVLAHRLLGPQARAMLLPPLVKPSGSGIFRRWATAHEFLDQATRGVSPNEAHAYALAIERGEPWAGNLPAASGSNPSAKVASIRDDYTRLRLDLLYRLERPALFDPSVAGSESSAAGSARKHRGGTGRRPSPSATHPGCAGPVLPAAGGRTACP